MVSRPRLSRRRFLQLLAAGAMGGGALAYMRWGEARWLEVTRRTISLGRDRGEKPLRILHLSDLHASDVVSLDFIARAVALGLATRPDLIVITGDFITSHYDDFDRYAATLHPLAAAAPTFATIGNHDGGAWARMAGGYAAPDNVVAMLAKAGIVYLHNETATHTIAGHPVQITGVGDLWSGTCDPTAAFARAPARGEARRLLLNHNPDAKDLLLPFDWDLVLCGHTHGGQLRLPVIGTPFAPVRDMRYVEGLHRWSNRWLFVTRGVGNLHGMRFNCRPEISVLELG